MVSRKFGALAGGDDALPWFFLTYALGLPFTLLETSGEYRWDGMGTLEWALFGVFSLLMMVYTSPSHPHRSCLCNN